jgi:hypothetical protein
MIFRGGARPRFLVSDWLFFVTDDGRGRAMGLYEVTVLRVSVCCKKHAPHLTRTDLPVGDCYDVVAELRSDRSQPFLHGLKWQTADKHDVASYPRITLTSLGGI